MGLTYRDFDGSDADYELLVEMINSRGDEHRTVDEMRLEDKDWKPENFRRREFVMEEQKCIGEASCAARPYPGNPRHYSIGLSLLPAYRDQGLEEEILSRHVELAESQGAQTVTAGACDDQAGRIAVLDRMGFRLVGRHVVSRLDLEEFEAAGFASTIRGVEEQGIVIRSAAELEDAGLDWLPHVYELENEVLDDLQVPHTQTFEEFRERLTGPPHWFPRGFVVALDGERWIGWSSLFPTPGLPDMAWTGSTCVLRSHRRRGIAMALKVSALERARREGVRFVKAANKENNPMLQLNFRLGFRPAYTGLTYRKVL